MIEVNYLEKNEMLECLEIKGHANYDKKGKDIVCSAVSAIGIGGLNALKSTDDIDIIVGEGFIKLSGDGLKEHDNQVVIKTMLIQLLTIERSYPEFIKVLNGRKECK